MDLIKQINNAPNPIELLPSLSVQELEPIIELCNDAYYNTTKSLLPDYIFDMLVEKLRLLAPNSPVLDKIGSTIVGKKTKLPYFLGSMNKIKSDEDILNKWFSKFAGPYVISDKLDGVSCLLVKKKSNIKLYTRGDGTTGKDISHLVDYINIPAITTETIVVRGELIITKKNFKKYQKVMSNARSMVIGLVNRKPDEINEQELKVLDFVAYEVIEPYKIPEEQFKLLEKTNLLVANHDIYDTLNHDILNGILEERKKQSDYEIDGLIVTDNNEHPRNTSGNPEYSFAYKGISEVADVKVVSIIWTPGKDGHIIPRIRFEMTRLSQANLTYTSGFHANFIESNKIGPGAIITIVRSGEVIPYILHVVKPAKKPGLPKKMDYVWDQNHVHIILKDPSKNKSVIIKRITKFLHDIGVENVSEGIVTRLVEQGYNTIPKVISLTEEQVLEIPGFQITSASKLISSIKNKMNNVDTLKLMVASNCFSRGFGTRKIKKILDNYPKIHSDYDPDDYDEWKEKIVELEGFNTKTAEQFLDNLPAFINFYKTIDGLYKIKNYTKTKTVDTKFNGMKIVFTGFRNAAWQQKIETSGGKVSGSVSSKTTLVVYKLGEENSSKYIKASKLGITLMEMTAFANKYKL